MEEELIDRFKQYPKGKGNQTIVMFIVSASLVVVSLLIVLLVELFRLPELLLIIAPICGIGAFGLSIGGIYIGFFERRYSTNWVKTGLVGHIVIVAAPVLLIIYEFVSIFLYYF